MSYGKKFSNKKWAINCRTVGDVIDELKMLSPDLPVQGSFEDSIDLVIFNRNSKDRHVGFADGGTWDEVSDE